MQSSDIRTRRVSSRYQVSSGGAHLIDGIAYGRSYVKRPGRPAVRIPPLKRPRLLYDEPEDEWSDRALGVDIDTDSHPGQLRITSSFEDADDDASVISGDEVVANEAENASAAPAARTLRSGSRRSMNTVRFEGDDEAMKDDDEDSDEEDFVPDDSKSSDDDFDDDDSSQRSPTPQMGSDAAPQNPSPTTTKRDQIPRSIEVTKEATKPSSAGTSMLSQPVVDPPSSSDSFGSGDENDVEDSKTVSLAEPEQHVQEPRVSGPGAGSAATRARNQRRKNSKKRDREFSQPIHKRLETAHEGDKDGNAASDSQNLSNSQRTHLRFVDESMEAPGANTLFSTPSQIDAVVSQSEATMQSNPPRAKVSQTQQNDREEPPEQISSRQPPHVSRNVSPQFGVTSTLVNKFQDTEKAKEGETSPPSATRRAKLDLTSSRRLVFGSLGIRAPKTKAEESKLQAKLAQTNSSPNSKAALKHNKDKDAAKSAQKPARIFTGDEWKEKIILSAVECCDKGVRLSTPPFPFVQRWDPQQQRGKKRKRAERGYYDGQFDNENGLLDEEGNAEYYDDGGYDDFDVDYDEEDPEAGLDVYDEAEKGEEDLPPLPEDLTTLHELKQSACQPGQIIAFKQLGVSQATNWAPTLSAHKTALINAVHPTTGLTELTLASRDVPVQHAEYDEEGNRIYGKFEMPQGEDDEEDPRRIEVQFDELVDPRILVDAPAQTPVVDTTDGDAGANLGSASPAEETTLIPDSLRPHDDDDDDHTADADIEDELEDSPALVPHAHSHSHSHSHSQQEQTTTTKSKAGSESESNSSAPNPKPPATTTATTSNEPSQALSTMSSAGAPATVANSGLDQAAQMPASLGSSNSGDTVQTVKETQGVQEMPLMMEGTPVVEARAG